MTARLRVFSDETFRSLRTRNFRLFFFGQGISQIGSWLTMVAQALLVLKITDSGIAVGVITACQFLPMLLLGAWGGLVADRSDKRKLLLVVQSFAMAQSFVLAALAFMDSPPVAALYAVAFAGGIALAFDNPTRRALVVEMVADDEVSNAVSLNSAVMTGARVVGPALAGLLITTVGFGWCFLLDGLSYIAVLTAIAKIRPAELRRSPRAESGKGQVRAGLRYISSVPDLWIPLSMLAIIGTLAFNFQVVMPLLVTRTFDSSAGMYTLLFSVVSIGSLLGALSAARSKTLGKRYLVTLEHRLRGHDAAARRRARAVDGVPDRVRRGLGERRVHHVVERRHSTARRPGDARPRPRHPGDRIPRQHADRWPDHRLDLGTRAVRARALRSAAPLASLPPRSASGRTGVRTHAPKPRGSTTTRGRTRSRSRSRPQITASKVHSPGIPRSSLAPARSELDSRPDDEVAHRRRDEHFTRRRERADPGPDVHGHAGVVIAAHFALTRVHARAHFEAEPPGVGDDRTRTLDRAAPDRRTRRSTRPRSCSRVARQSGRAHGRRRRRARRAIGSNADRRPR